MKHIFVTSFVNIKRYILSTAIIFLCVASFFETAHALPIRTIRDNYLNRFITWNGVSAGYLLGTNSWRKYKAYPNRITIDNSLIRKGSYSIRYECKPGDTSNAHSDKAELIGMLNNVGTQILKTGGTWYYGLSIRFPLNWIPPIQPDDDPARLTFFQFHKTSESGFSDDGTGPAIALIVQPTFKLKTHGGNLDDTASIIEYSQDFSVSDINKGHWIDLIVQITFDKVNGQVIVYRRDDDETTFTNVCQLDDIPTLFYFDNGSVSPLELHGGIYREKQDVITNVFNYGVFIESSAYSSASNFLLH